VLDVAAGHQWFPWADHKSDGTLAVAWDEDVQPAGGTAPVNDQFVHVLRTSAGRQILGPLENLDVWVTHCAGQYVAQPAWPEVCSSRLQRLPVIDAEGKDCNVFHGDYTGLGVDSAGGLDGPEPLRPVASARLLHRRTPRRLRPGRHARPP
jgi:hypothetical protein